MARLRITIDPDGHASASVVFQMGGTEVEHGLDGFGMVELKGGEGGSVVNVSFFGKAVEFVSEAYESAGQKDEPGQDSVFRRPN
jgi:hypothetical protein